MIVKFKAGAAAYGLGYVEKEVADISKVTARVLTTLVDANGNPKGMDWRDKKLDVDDLIAKGICVPASKEEIEKFEAENGKGAKGNK